MLKGTEMENSNKIHWKVNYVDDAGDDDDEDVESEKKHLQKIKTEKNSVNETMEILNFKEFFHSRRFFELSRLEEQHQLVLVKTHLHTPYTTILLMSQILDDNGSEILIFCVFLFVELEILIMIVNL